MASRLISHFLRSPWKWSEFKWQDIWIRDICRVSNERDDIWSKDKKDPQKHYSKI